MQKFPFAACVKNHQASWITGHYVCESFDAALETRRYHLTQWNPRGYDGFAGEPVQTADGIWLVRFQHRQTCNCLA